MEERRHSDILGERLSRIEEKLDNTLSWLSKRDRECNIVSEQLNLMRIEQGKQGILVWFFSGLISMIIAGTISFWVKHK